MTTLPQNLSTRTSRPGVPGSGNSGNPAVAQGMTGADAIRVLRGNIWVLLALLVVSAVVGYVINSYLDRYYSRYTAQGWCEIRLSAAVSPLTRGATTFDNQTTGIEQRTQVQSMRSEALFSRVLQNDNSQIRNTTWFKSFSNPSERRQDLVKNFSVNAIPETRLISASMQYSNPEDARIIVQEIVDEHLRQQAQIALNNEFDRNQQLNTMKLRAEADLRAVAEDRRDVANQLSTAGVSPTSSITINPKNIETEIAAKGLVEAQSNLDRAKSSLDQIQQSIAAGQDPPQVVSQVEEDPQILSMTNELRAVESNLKALQSMGMGEGSRQVTDNTNRLSSLRSRLDDLKKELITKKKTQAIEGLQAAIKSGEQSVEQLTKKLAELQKGSAEIANLSARYQSLITRETALQQSLREITDSLDRSSTGASSSTIAWAIRPIKPEIPSFPKLSVTLSLAITVGLGLGLAVAFAREILDTTIRSPRDVAKVGSVAVLGTIPHEDDDPQSAGARLPLVIAEAPQSMTAENLRQFRTRLQHTSSLDTMRSLMVTSPNPGDGKTTVAANLAAGLALVGRRILLVDANFRRPELHKLFAIDNTQGFSTALTAPDQITTLAKATKIPNLSVLATGPKPANATEMLESALLHDFIEKAIENYDHIIFDSGPILFASETVAMAPRVDGVVTVVRARQSTRGVLGRVRETLRQIKAEHLGVVINGIRAYGGGYYSRNIKTYYEYSSSNNNG